MRVRRRVRRPPDLTSLFDVLFIVVFVALIRAAAAQQAAEQASKPPPKPPEPPPVPASIAQLKQRAVSAIAKQLDTRVPLVIRISERGVITALETDKTIALDVPLLEASTNPDVQQAYLGDRSTELRLCRVAAVHLNAPDLGGYLVIVAPAVPRAKRTIALNEGLDRDVARCATDQRGVATIVDPGAP